MANMEQIQIWKAQSVTFSVTCQNQYREQSESIKHTNVHLHSQIRKLLSTNKFWSLLQKWESTVTPQKTVDKFQIYTYEATFLIFKSLLNKRQLAYTNAYGLPTRELANINYAWKRTYVTAFFVCLFFLRFAMKIVLFRTKRKKPSKILSPFSPVRTAG